MSTSISGITGSSSAINYASMSGGMKKMHRPDPSQMADKLFSQLDTKGQGYIEKSDLQSAFDQLSSSGNSTSSTNVDDVFSQLDSDSDGKITKQEMSSSLQKLADQLDSQFNQMRMSGAGKMPPPPPPGGGEDAGFTQDELTGMAEELSSTDSARADLMSSLASNFEEADTDGDGKVSFKEAMAFDQASQATSSTSSEPGNTSAADSESTGMKVMMQIMRLMQAYGVSGNDANDTASTGTLFVSA